MDPDYPRTHFQWHPKDGMTPIPDNLWSAICRNNQAKAKNLRRARKPFAIVEYKPNAYRIEPIP